MEIILYLSSILTLSLSLSLAHTHTHTLISTLKATHHFSSLKGKFSTSTGAFLSNSPSCYWHVRGAGSSWGALLLWISWIWFLYKQDTLLRFQIHFFTAKMGDNSRLHGEESNVLHEDCPGNFLVYMSALHNSAH